MSRSQQSGDGAQSRQLGDKTEDAVILAVDGLQYVPDRDNPHADAVAIDVVDPRTSVASFCGICLLERGTSVEIKSTMLEIGSGRRGRFAIRKSQHDWLLANGGVYLFALCRPTYQRDLLELRVVPATLVDELDWSWRQASHERERETYAQITWTQIWHPDEVDPSEVVA